MDIFHGRALSPAGPATDIMPVTPNDGADLAITASALFIEIGGVIEIVTVRDECHQGVVCLGSCGHFCGVIRHWVAPWRGLRSPCLPALHRGLSRAAGPVALAHPVGQPKPNGRGGRCHGPALWPRGDFTLVRFECGR